jgi:DNA-binding response OmpR family regulator
MKILLIEDEATLAQGIQEYLQAEGGLCEIAATFEQATEKVALYTYDCILVDIGLPDGNGLAIIQQLKAAHAKAGIIIISAKNALDDKIQGLELGADDYLGKPFHLSELNARIKALVRRQEFGGQTSIVFEEIEVFPDEKRVVVGDTPLPLTRTEYDLLLYFLANHKRVLSRESIAEHLVGDQADEMDNFDFIYSHIKHLRKKLSQSGAGDYLKAVYGIGYKWTNQ